MRPATFPSQWSVALQGVEIVPDVCVEASAADFLAGRDPVLARALR